MDTQEFDADGYPTDATLDEIRHWAPSRSYRALMAFVRTAWRYADDGYWEEFDDSGVRHYRLHTAGWSGNESLIGAMKGNRVFWSIHWLSSRRGGHYEFEIKTPTAS